MNETIPDPHRRGWGVHDGTSGTRLHVAVDTRTTQEGAELTVVVPCFNERENVPLLVDRLTATLDGVAWEVIFVDDDSPDRTADDIRRIARNNSRVRCVERIGRRGLSSAAIEGVLASSAPFVAVMDADLQHDETLLPRMFELLKGDDTLDIVVGSRYVDGGRIDDWDRKRAMMSNFATLLSRFALREELADPMSGFFMVRREVFDRSVRNLSGQGFKILLDIFLSAGTSIRFRELPYTFRKRIHGDSKVDTLVLWEFLTLLLDKLVGWLVPVRFLMFGAVGATGVALHLFVLRLALMVASFAVAQTIATLMAMTTNFFLNNMLTYRDRRLRGWNAVRGLFTFYAVCGIGVIANVGVAAALFREQYSWYVSGLAGVAVGVVWNYAVSSVFTWRNK